MAKKKKLEERNWTSFNSCIKWCDKDYVQVKINNTQKNRKCMLCGDRDETVNHIISECSNLAQKEYKSRHNWVGKVIHLELCKKVKFYHINKCYIQKLEYVLKKKLNAWNPLGL